MRVIRSGRQKDVHFGYGCVSYLITQAWVRPNELFWSFSISYLFLFYEVFTLRA